MEIGVVLIVAIVAVCFALVRAGAPKELRRLKGAYESLADATGLRYRFDRERGPTLRGHRAGVELIVFRTKLEGEPFHCATATAARRLPSIVAHSRAFPFPSVARRGAPRFDTGDEAFERKYELYGRFKLPVDVRNALLMLPCAELTVLLQRVSVVWPAEREAPTPEEIDSARTAVEALARGDEGDAYR